MVWADSQFGANEETVVKLIDLISAFRRGLEFDDFCSRHGLNAGAEVIEIYVRQPVSLESDLGFFEIDVTKGRFEYEEGGVKYQSLFDFFFFLDFMEEARSNCEFTDVQLAEKLFSYAIKDA